MFDKFMLWILGKAYKYHKVREVHYYDKAYYAFVMGLDDEENRYFKRYTYHNTRCGRIDTLIYALEGS